VVELTEEELKAAAATAPLAWLEGSTGGLGGDREVRGAAVRLDGSTVRIRPTRPPTTSVPPWRRRPSVPMTPEALQAALAELGKDSHWKAGSCPPRKRTGFVGHMCADCVTSFFSVKVRRGDESRVVSCHDDGTQGGCEVVIEQGGKKRASSCYHDAPQKGWVPFFEALLRETRKALAAP
jgi:hypothetical protein